MDNVYNTYIAFCNKKDSVFYENIIDKRVSITIIHDIRVKFM